MGKARTCAMFGCTPGKSTLRKYYTFPKRRELAEAWLHLCYRDDKVNLASAVVCELHFSAKQKKRNLKYELLKMPLPVCHRDLIDDAIPDQHLPGLPGHGEESPAGASTCSPSPGSRFVSRRRGACRQKDEEIVKSALEAYDSLQFMESQSTQIKEEAFPGESCSLPLEMVIDEGPGTFNASSPTSLATVKAEPFIEMVEVKEEKCEHEEEDLEIKQEQFHWWGSNL